MKFTTRLGASLSKLARAVAAGVALACSKLAAAGVFLIPVLPLLGAGIIVIAGAVVAYRLIEPKTPGLDPAIEFVPHLPDGGFGPETDVSLGKQGENDPRLAPFVGLPAPGSSQPAPGVASAPLRGTPAASGPAGGSKASLGTFGTPYEQAAALGSMMHWDRRTYANEGWPVLNFCRAGVTSLSCQHNDFWLRNDAPVALHDVSLCIGQPMQGVYRLAGAAADGCLHTDIAADGDLHLDIIQEQTPPDYPDPAELRLEWYLPSWKPHTLLGWLRIPLLRPQTFFPLLSPTDDDERHDIAVQARRVNLLAKLVVFTYHGSANSSLRVQDIQLKDPQKALRIIPAKQAPAAFARYKLRECSASAGDSTRQAGVLYSGQSCAVLVSGKDTRDPAYSQAADNRIDGQLDASFLHRTSKNAVGSLEIKTAGIVIRHLTAAGGDFTRAGLSPAFPTAATHLVLLATDAMHPAPGLMLSQDSTVDSISASPDGTKLWVGGTLAPVAGALGQVAPTAYLASSDGESWNYWFPEVGPDGPVLALTPGGDRLYVGGAFQHVDGQLAPGIDSIAHPDDEAFLPGAHSDWAPLGSGLVASNAQGLQQPGVVRSLYVAPGGFVVAGGQFQFAPPPLDGPGAGNPQLAAHVPNVAVWNANAQAWQSVGGVLPGLGQEAQAARVNALAGYAGCLMVGGRFVQAGRFELPGAYVEHASAWARLDPQALAQGLHAWRAEFDGLHGRVDSFITTAHGIYAGGSFTGLDGQHHALLLEHEGVLSGLDQDLFIQGSNQATGAGSEIMAMTQDGSDLCVGGSFTETADGLLAENLACRSLVDDQDRFPAQGVNAAVRSLGTLWEIEL